ncbi:MAG: ribosome silencing factor [Deltaproteobacteria bacterium]|nr:ribosome silencing factor [Deltaproteobacteria bacterium]RLB65641.1 MAG: ribosome silencing factor [Deltaproteobacteria bacterium]
MLSEERAQKCAAYVLDKKAFNVRILDVRKISSLTDFIVLASGSSDRQVKAAAEAVHLGLKNDHDTMPIGIEGLNEGRWALIDYGDVMVHVFHEPVRLFYDLDGLWCDAEEVTVQEDTAGAVQITS